MGEPEVDCHKNHAAQCQEQELYGACGEPDAPHTIRGIGQKEEGGHYAWDISPKKYRLSEMNEQMEGERQKQCRPNLSGEDAIDEHIAGGDDQHNEFFSCRNGKGRGAESGKMFNHGAKLRKSRSQRLPMCQHPTMLHSHFLSVVEDESDG